MIAKLSQDSSSPRVLCTVCARGGSKGVMGKNTIELYGKPLIVHSLDSARESGVFHSIIVSTDCSRIATVAETAGVDLVISRPVELSTDSSPKVPVIRHALLSAEARLNQVFDIIVDLDATSPLRKADDIINCVSLLQSSNADNLITASPSRRSPYFNMVEFHDGQIRVCKRLQDDVTRRQEAPRTFDMNASVYVWRRSALLESNELFRPTTILYEMPLERSWDIDEPIDVEIVKFFMARNASVR